MQNSGEMRREIVKLYQRHCERSEAIHLSTCGAMDCFAALAMTLRGPQRTGSPILLAAGPEVVFCGAAKLSRGDPSNGQWQFGWLVCIGPIGMQASEPALARSEAMHRKE